MATDSETVLGLELVAKADAVVSALESVQEMSAQQLAERTQEPVSSTYRLLKSLTDIGWIEPGEQRGLYRLGVYFMRISGLLEDRLDVRREAFEPLRSLQRVTGWTTYLHVRRGSRAVCVERFEGRQIRSMALQVGDSLPLHVDAAPTTLLTYLPAGERESTIDELLRGPGDDRWPGPSRRGLDAVVRTVRSHGFARSDGALTAGLATLAAPVFNHRGELEAAVSVSGLSATFLPQEAATVPELLQTARIVSRALGYREEDRGGA